MTDIISNPALQKFLNETNFPAYGAFITDLDGTAIHELQGVYSIPPEVEQGLGELYRKGRQVVLNTLRFPLSVIRTFGKAWYNISGASIPCILMNGSQLGYLKQEGNGEFSFEEVKAFPLSRKEVEQVLSVVNSLVEGGELDLLVFIYPRDWKKGEIIWTPDPGRVSAVQQKYQSASRVFSSNFIDLATELFSEELCMLFLLLDLPGDKLMAYQHTKRENFFTQEGTDKNSGLLALADILDFDPSHSIGAGDSMMDNFLLSTGLSILVGKNELPYQGKFGTVRVNDSIELGKLLFQLSRLHESART